MINIESAPDAWCLNHTQFDQCARVQSIADTALITALGGVEHLASLLDRIDKAPTWAAVRSNDVRAARDEARALLEHVTNMADAYECRGGV